MALKPPSSQEEKKEIRIVGLGYRRFQDSPNYAKKNVQNITSKNNNNSSQVRIVRAVPPYHRTWPPGLN